MTLRPFSMNDWAVISQHQYPNLSKAEVQSMISQWNTRQYDGRYFEMLAVEDNGNIVGYVSLFEQDNASVSEGVEIYTPYRQHGFAYAAIIQLFQYAKKMGYSTVTAQVRHDNIASLALHKKLGFETIGLFTNKRGHLVYALSKEL